MRDPLAEEEHMPVDRVVHRYRDRALLLVTLDCASYCRHCTRKRLVGQHGGTISRKELDEALGYLRGHPEVRDLLISGGEPLILPDEVLGNILGELRRIPSIEIIRIGTRIPAVLPFRITPGLVQLLARHGPLYLSTHFNHPRELSEEARESCAMLADGGIPLANQTVLLSGVNDRTETIEELCRALLRSRVRPYYLLQGDLVRGIEHLRTPLSRGVEIMEALRGRLSGLALPTFVLDAPHGSGKIPLGPNYIVSWGPGRTVLRNFEGQMIVYPDPVLRAGPQAHAGGDPKDPTKVSGAQAAFCPAPLDGVAGLLAGSTDPLVPQGLERQSRQRPRPEQHRSQRDGPR